MAVKDRTFKILQSQHAEQSLNNEDRKEEQRKKITQIKKVHFFFKVSGTKEKSD